MVSIEYAYAYKEVIELLKYMPVEEVEKIPPKKLRYYLQCMDKDYQYTVDENKTFEEQEKSKLTETIFAILFRDYWATPYEKERILTKEKYDLEKEEQEKREKYSIDNIFNNKKENIMENRNDVIVDNLQLMEIKEKNWLKKIWNKIINMLKLNDN